MKLESDARQSLPPLVREAQALAERMGFTGSRLPEAGRALHLLAAMRPHGRLGEIGAGCGVSTAWMASALGAQARVYSVELDPNRAAAVQALFRPINRVHLIQGDWPALLEHGPFDLLFVDVAGPKQTLPQMLVEVLAPGGALIVDDLTPTDRWPEEKRGQPDPVRQRLLHSADLVGLEIRIMAESSIIVAAARLIEPCKNPPRSNCLIRLAGESGVLSTPARVCR